MRDATRVCVNVAPENLRARRFYARHGAAPLSEDWMVRDDIAVATGQNGLGRDPDVTC
jgi:hypothetical protein